MKTVLVVCATPRDKRELSKQAIASKYKIIFYECNDHALEKIMCDGIGWLTYDFNPADLIEDICIVARQHNVDGIMSTEDYPGCILASIVAQKLGLPGPDPRVVIGHQHKYYSRVWQKRYVPEATPQFQLIDPHKNEVDTFLSFPFFLKPVNSSFSVFANEIHSYDSLNHWVKHSQFPVRFSEQFNCFLDHCDLYDVPANTLLAEELLTGEQCTIEGFVQDGIVTMLGVVDSIMFPGTISFKRFEYPSCLPQKVQTRMADIASALIRQTGFDNSFFNVEFMYNSKTGHIHIIEVNPRGVSQFADLYEKVDGTNSYEQIIQVALGQRPHSKKREGKHAIAASCVLRVFENKRVAKAPGKKEINVLACAFPDARCQFFVPQGGLLSDASQDGKSYRYGLIHLGARNRKELLEKFEHCKRILNFEFENV